MDEVRLAVKAAGRVTAGLKGTAARRAQVGDGHKASLVRASARDKAFTPAPKKIR
jgi:hypothetical protein